MTANYKFDKSFGPIGSSAGIFLFVAGLAITYISKSGLILSLIGAFVGFTSTSTFVDFDKRRLRYTNYIFGIIPIGQWVTIKPEMKIGFKKSNKVWKAYSRGNRTIEISEKGFTIFLYNSNGKELIPIKKAKNLELAKMDIDKLSQQLGISVI
jgi:hypothetical protein